VCVGVVPGVGVGLGATVGVGVAVGSGVAVGVSVGMGVDACVGVGPGEGVVDKLIPVNAALLSNEISNLRTSKTPSPTFNFKH